MDAREQSPEKKMLYQDYFNFLEETTHDLAQENNFEINFYDTDEIDKEKHC